MTERWLHLLTRVALHVMNPRDVLALVTHVARSLTPLPPTASSVTLLGRRGSCLSRSITLAARIPGARVAVGVKKHGYRAVGATRFGLRGRDAISAHAWVEVDGHALSQGEEFGKVIAYIQGDDRNSTDAKWRDTCELPGNTEELLS